MSKFDPKPHIRKVQYTERKTGKVITKEILDTGPRLAWFRSDHPIEEGWRILTSCIRLDENGAHYLAEIVNPEGIPIATGNRLVFAKDFENYNEKAETQAIGRALSVCGYGTLQALEPGDEDGEEQEATGMPDTPARAMPAPTPLGAGTEIAQPTRKVLQPTQERRQKATAGEIMAEANAQLEAMGLPAHYKDSPHIIQAIKKCGHTNLSTTYFGENFAQIVGELVDRVEAGQQAE